MPTTPEPNDAAEDPRAPPKSMISPVPDGLRDHPAEVVAIPPAPYATVLPFHEVSPEDFERVCLIVIEHIDAVREARLYGTRGQEDHGIDLIAWDDDGGLVLYQVKRYQEFREDDLETAVKAYVKGERGTGTRAFRPKRFVLCVACPIKDTDRRQITDTLVRLRGECDFAVDLYDARQLTNRLEGHEDLIRRFFGPGWVETLARGSDRMPAQPVRPDMVAEAVLRGPLKALGLDQHLAQADDSRRPPAERAAIVREAARELRSFGFASFADDLRLREAAYLCEAGDLAAAAGILANIVWRDHSTGSVMGSHQAERELEGLELESLGPAWASFRVALNLVGDWYANTDDSVAAVFEVAADLVGRRHPEADEVVLWAAETAVAVRDFESLGASRSLVESIVTDRTVSKGIDDELAVRLRCALSDLTGESKPVEELARGGRLGHRLAALVFSRLARAAALHCDPDKAVLYEREAVREACQAECYEDAADAVLAWMRVELDYQLSDETFGRPKIALGVREAGRATLLPRTKCDEAGKAALRDEHVSTALANFRQYLREVVTTGRLTDEREAEQLLGETLVKARDLERGVEHLVRAGQHTQVAALLDGQVGWADVLKSMADGPPWERASAFTSVMPSAEYIPDEVVATVGELALIGTQFFNQTIFAPLVWLEAWKALAAVGDRLPVDQARRALDLLDPLVERDAATYRHNDNEHIAVVAQTFRAHPELRDRCISHLLRLIAQGDSLADRTLREAWDLVSEKPPAVVNGLSRLADDGSQAALRALMLLNVDHPKLTALALGRVRAELHQQPRPPGSYGIGTGLTETGILARLVNGELRDDFARYLSSFVQRTDELEPNRTDAAHALVNLADTISDTLRDELFAHMMAVAAGPPEVSEMDKSLQASADHPPSTIRIHLAWGSLQPAAARAAGRLARTNEQYCAVAELVIPLLQQLPEPFTNDLSHTLHDLPPEAQRLDLNLISRMSSVWLRQLAAAVWVHRPDEPSGLGDRLASDPDLRVRRTLADGIALVADQDPGQAERLRERLIRDPAWSVRHRVVTIAP